MELLIYVAFVLLVGSFWGSWLRGIIIGGIGGWVFPYIVLPNPNTASCFFTTVVLVVLILFVRLIVSGLKSSGKGSGSTGSSSSSNSSGGSDSSIWDFFTSDGSGGCDFGGGGDCGGGGE